MINAPWDTFVEALDSSFQRALRRKLNKAARAGTRVTSYSPHNDSDSDSLIERAFSVASRSWKSRQGSAIMSTETLRRFYRGVARGGARGGWLRMAFLECEDRDIAFELNLDYGGSRFSIKMAYDDNYASLSPGVVLRYHVLKDAFEQKLNRFCFLGDREKHKSDWACGCERFGQVTVFNRRPIPMARYVVSGPVRRVLRKVRPLRALKRRLAHAK